MTASPPSEDWGRFKVAARGQWPKPPRSLDGPEGVGDRLRAAAFAEVQARDAFLWAAGRFEDAPEPLRKAWVGLAHAEQRHLDWLLARMTELGIDPAGREVSDMLWDSLMSCQSAETFSVYMATAEERGRRAGERFAEGLAKTDPVTAAIFGRIAREEVEHIELARRWFPHASKLPPAAAEAPRPA